jgi:hypothetical protein
VTQVNPAFDASGSVLQIPNAIRTPNAMSARTFLNTLIPYAAHSSPMFKAQAEESSRQDNPR